MRIGIVAGEPSGDRLAAGLIDAVRRRAPLARFSGMAADAVRKARRDKFLAIGRKL